MNRGFRAIHRIFNALSVTGGWRVKPMSLFRTLLSGVIAAGLLASPALADRPRDQDRAFQATREGRSMPLPMIERRVMPFMGGAGNLRPAFPRGSFCLQFLR